MVILKLQRRSRSLITGAITSLRSHLEVRSARARVRWSVHSPCPDCRPLGTSRSGQTACSRPHGPRVRQPCRHRSKNNSVPDSADPPSRRFKGAQCTGSATPTWTRWVMLVQSGLFLSTLNYFVFWTNLEPDTQCCCMTNR